MKVMAILGSRNPEGQTARAVEAYLQGVAGGGGECEKVYLPETRMERCRQCENDGWGICRTEGTCIIEDDFASLVEKIRQADAVILATPVYFSDLSESMYAFLDRLRRTCMHEFGKSKTAGKPAVGICVAGGGGGGAPTCSGCMEKISNYCGFDLVDMIPVRRQNLDMKLGILETSGQWLAGYLASQ